MTDSDSAASAASKSGPTKPNWWALRFTFTGAAVGLVFLWLSMTPSLLPRGPLVQGLISGAAAAVGYAAGVFAVSLVRFMRSGNSTAPAPRWAWIALAAVGVIGQIGMIIWFHGWQTELRDLMDVPQLGFWDYPLAAGLTAILLCALLKLGQAVGALTRNLVRTLNHAVPPRVSIVVTVVVLLVLGVALVNGLVVRVVMNALNTSFAAINDEDHPDFAAPDSPLRSGGPGSLVSWESLGRQGRIFVAAGPTVAELTEFSGKPATEPIRVYAGLHSADGIRATAALAARELERTGGLDRQLIAVATTTGTGWLNQAQADALEYMYNGDSAIVSMQYSFLPSGLSFLVDKENARQAGQALFEAVDVLLQQRPQDQRPKIVVFGESLGSFGGEAPFLSLQNLVARTDGALFTGPTFNNTIWRDLTRNRDTGSPEWLPIYRDGAHVRFIDAASDFDRPPTPWLRPRVVYLQYPSDPITWWAPDLAFSKPDWPREARGPDVLPSVQWIPVVTFLQVAADMTMSTNVPDGHGHVFIAGVADAWAQILQPPGWTPQMTTRLRPLLRATAV
jgi:uncharacterized membrane protein